MTPRCATIKNAAELLKISKWLGANKLFFDKLEVHVKQ